MILEHVILPVRKGQEAAFEAAMAQARPLIERQPGFGGMELRRGMEQANHYLLLVKWGSVADHEEGFRTSEDYQAWRALLHPFYDPMPVVVHFGDVL